jgi:hypothetical protein
MIKKNILALFTIYSLLVLIFLPNQNFGQTENTVSDKSISIAEKISIKEKKGENIVTPPAKDPTELNQDKPVKNTQLTKTISQYKRESKLEKPQTNTNFEKLEKVTYKLSDDNNNKKKKNWSTGVTIAVVIGVVGLVALAVLVIKSDCDPNACDPFDENCYCG